MKFMTIRNVPQELAAALEAEKRRRGVSLNEAVLGLLAQALGLRSRRCNGLAACGGTWSEQEYQDFQRAIDVTEQIDPELWR